MNRCTGNQFVSVVTFRIGYLSCETFSCISHSVGSKRKHSQSDYPQDTIIPATLKTIEAELMENSNIDDLISTHISNIRSGNNSDLVQQALHLEKYKDKQIAAADKLRKLQIKNINQLFEFELENVKALFEVCFIVIIIAFVYDQSI